MKLHQLELSMFDIKKWDSIRIAAENGDFDDEYANFLMNNTDLMIGNGDMLITAMENSACWDDFVDFLYESPVTTIPQWAK